MNFIRKTLIWFFIVSLAMPTNFVLAFSYPSPTEALDEILGDLGIDKTELKKTTGNINVLSNKENLPTVTLTFVPENPAPGKELTAIAVPAYFIGDVQQMYYTWYLKRKITTDWNEDGKKDVEDYKIEAMRIVARGETEEVFNYTSDDDDDGYEASFGGADQKGKPAHCYVRDVKTGEDTELGGGCNHLFPDTNDHGEVGDGKFGLSEEKFWGTDPHSADTNNDGVPDEQALTGKGIMAFTWLYQEGDEIGVAVEGVVESTDYKDSSLKTMWAISGNPDMGPTLSNINTVLGDSLTKPTTGTAYKKIDINLYSSPQYPINDPRGQDEGAVNNSDTLTIKANLANIENRSFVKYDWGFWLCEEGGINCVSDNTDSKQPISLTSLRENFGLSKVSGRGFDTVKLKLMLDPAKENFYTKFETKDLYLKAQLQVFEDTETITGKYGQGSLLIPLQKSEDDIIPGKITLMPNPSVAAGAYFQQTTTPNTSRYGDVNLSLACPNKTCPVVKNEIIGAHYNGAVTGDFAWYLNGKPLVAGAKKEQVFFPILQGSGFTYSLKLDIVDGTKKISLTRDFKVEDPKVVIEPGCKDSLTGCTKPAEVILGTIILDQTDSQSPSATKEDISQDLFQAEEVSTVTLAPNFNFDDSILSKDVSANFQKLSWFVDGVKITSDDVAPFPNINPTTGELNIPINKAAGEKYKISIEALYTQPDAERNALKNIWGVSEQTFYEKTIVDSAEILVVAPNTLGKTETKKIMASLFSDLPEYLSFLFRVFVTIALIMFLANLSLVLLPRRS